MLPHWPFMLTRGGKSGTMSPTAKLTVMCYTGTMRQHVDDLSAHVACSTTQVTWSAMIVMIFCNASRGLSSLPIRTWKHLTYSLVGLVRQLVRDAGAMLKPFSAVALGLLEFC